VSVAESDATEHPAQPSNPFYSSPNLLRPMYASNHPSSMLQHVKVNYEDGSSLADFSSSSSQTDDQGARAAPQGLPIVRESSDVEPCRLRDNFALRRIDSRVTTTQQSDIWSFDSQSSALASSPRTIPGNAPSICQAHPLVPPIPPRNHKRIEDVNSHLHQTSVDEVVEQSVFLSSPVPANNPRVNCHPTRSSPVSQKLSPHSSSWKTVTTQIPPNDPNPTKSHQRHVKQDVTDPPFDLSNNKSRLSLWSEPSHWSADFDKFEDYDQVKAQNAANDQLHKEKKQTRPHRGAKAANLASSTDFEATFNEVTYSSESNFGYGAGGNNEDCTSGLENADVPHH
jgi:hypothetical protein